MVGVLVGGVPVAMDVGVMLGACVMLGVGVIEGEPGFLLLAGFLQGGGN